MKRMNDPDLRFIEALSGLESPEIAEFLDGEERLAARRSADRKRRLGALAACLAIAGGAGIAVYTGTLDSGIPPADTATVPLPGANTSAPAETEPAQTGKTTERRVIYGSPAISLDKLKKALPENTIVDVDSLEFDCWYDAYNEMNENVFFDDDLLEAFNSAIDDETLFAVHFSIDLGEHSIPGYAHWKDYNSLCQKEKEWEERYFSHRLPLPETSDNVIDKEYVWYGLDGDEIFIGSRRSLPFHKNCKECEALMDELSEILENEKDFLEKYREQAGELHGILQKCVDDYLNLYGIKADGSAESYEYIFADSNKRNRRIENCYTTTVSKKQFDSIIRESSESEIRFADSIRLRFFLVPDESETIDQETIESLIENGVFFVTGD